MGRGGAASGAGSSSSDEGPSVLKPHEGSSCPLLEVKLGLIELQDASKTHATAAPHLQQAQAAAGVEAAAGVGAGPAAGGHEGSHSHSQSSGSSASSRLPIASACTSTLTHMQPPPAPIKPKPRPPKPAAALPPRPPSAAASAAASGSSYGPPRRGLPPLNVVKEDEEEAMGGEQEASPLTPSTSMASSDSADSHKHHTTEGGVSAAQEAAIKAALQPWVVYEEEIGRQLRCLEARCRPLPYLESSVWHGASGGSLSGDEASSHGSCTDDEDDAQRHPPRISRRQHSRRKRDEEERLRMRFNVVDWLMTLHHKTRPHLQPRTLFLAVAILDRYCAVAAPSSLLSSSHYHKLQLTALAAFFLACKYEEVLPPSVVDVLRLSNYSHSRRELLRMERCVLEGLGFSLLLPTPRDFIDWYLRRHELLHACPLARPSPCPPLSPSCLARASYYLERALLDHHGSLAYKPSVLSAASLYLAQRNELHYSTSPHWDPTTHHDTTEPRAWGECWERVTGLREADLLPAAITLSRLAQDPPPVSSSGSHTPSSCLGVLQLSSPSSALLPLTALTRKYSLPSHARVALLPHLLLHPPLLIV